MSLACSASLSSHLCLIRLFYCLVAKATITLSSSVTCLCTYLSLCQSFYLSIHLCMFVCIVYLFFIYLFIYLSIYLFNSRYKPYIFICIYLSFFLNISQMIKKNTTEFIKRSNSVFSFSLCSSSCKISLRLLSAIHKIEIQSLVAPMVPSCLVTGQIKLLIMFGTSRVKHFFSTTERSKINPSLVDHGVSK